MDTDFTSPFDSGRIQHEMSSFEKHLSEQAIGTSPENRDEILYQCGYAAASVANKKQQLRHLKLWRCIGIAASIVATFSLSSHYIMNTMNKPGSSDIAVEQPKPSISTQSIPNSSTTDNFVVHPNEQSRHESDENVSYQTTAQSSRIRLDDFIEQDSWPSPKILPILLPSVNDSDRKTLQPKDSLSVLTGEA
jgi:hypothetical protein